MLNNRKLILFLLFSIWPFFAAASDADNAARLIAVIEKGDPNFLYDMHGNSNRELRALQLSRFRATPEIMRAIDRLEKDRSRVQHAAALYDVLGFVKDPASIEWLRRKVGNKDAVGLYENWMQGWLGSFDGYGTWPWLEGRARWIGFFIDTYKHETRSTIRSDLLSALSGFDDPLVVNFFQEQGRLALDSRETLAVERYLERHGGEPNKARIQKAIQTLSLNPDNRQFLIEFAYSFRHEAFVPFLISALDSVPKDFSREASWNAQDALEHITFEIHVRGKDAWVRWAAENGAAGRLVWRDRAVDLMRRTLQKDVNSALALFEKTVYRWSDILFLSFIETELATRSAFHSNIAGWINLTYEPIIRARLVSVARLITARPKALEPWARELLVARDFLPGREKQTWDQLVQMHNGRV